MHKRRLWFIVTIALNICYGGLYMSMLDIHLNGPICVRTCRPHTHVWSDRAQVTPSHLTILLGPTAHARAIWFNDMGSDRNAPRVRIGIRCICTGCDFLAFIRLYTYASSEYPSQVFRATTIYVCMVSSMIEFLIDMSLDNCAITKCEARRFSHRTIEFNFYNYMITTTHWTKNRPSTPTPPGRRRRQQSRQPHAHLKHQGQSKLI